MLLHDYGFESNKYVYQFHYSFSAIIVGIYHFVSQIPLSLHLIVNQDNNIKFKPKMRYLRSRIIMNVNMIILSRVHLV